jgi:hypothetical protein
MQQIVGLERQTAAPVLSPARRGSLCARALAIAGWLATI